MTFAERVTYQRAIEDVYWRHRIWPKENPDPKPSLDAVMSQAQLEKKVTGYLRDSQALDDNWQKPITADQLQAEMERMARDTKQPEVLHELFDALGNDPFVIAECLARPLLTDRLLADLSAQDKGRHFGSVRAEELNSKSMTTMLEGVAYTLPNIFEGGEPPCTDDTWTRTTTTNAPEGRFDHTAVWTGSEMIVWGGVPAGHLHDLRTGGRYNPSTDSWAATSITNAPAARYEHTAVWTGSEMIVWGGEDQNVVLMNTGGRYNPSTDSWTATSTNNAPDARASHTAVWTGSEMIVWGGTDDLNSFDTGGSYNPSTDSWTATSTNNAPDARYSHKTVWTGTEMIVWGGLGSVNIGLNTGGRYNPSTDSWTATSTNNAPDARASHTAVWTGGEMIVWGGVFVDGTQNHYLDTGGRYDPGMDSWTATSTTNAPEGRFDHTAVWSGQRNDRLGGDGH